ncbi:dihydroorotase [Patescibacteria group bacterium]|nr:dihydroorotase [Patescibacteria group bacterium]
MGAILINNGHVIDPAQKINEICSVLVKDGKVAKIGKRIVKPKTCTVINAKGKIVTPGWIDMHVHLREPGREDQETIATCTRAAAKGGITSICSMPNSGQIADNQAVVEFIVSRAKRDGVVNVFPYGAITKGLKGEELAEIWEMKDAGIVGVSEDHRDVQNLALFRMAIKYCKTFNVPIICHSENENLACGGVMHEGKVSTYLGLPGNPASAESSAIAAQIILSEEADYPLHFTHVSAAASIESIRCAKKRKIAVTADCTSHHFSLTDEACLGYNTAAKVNPPLRSEKHKNAVLKGLKDGTIDCICTDHAPHTFRDKYVDFEHAAFGIVGLETLIPLVITNLVNKKVLTLRQAIEKVTVNPAGVVNIDKGSLKVGMDADITVIDLKEERVVDKNNFESKGRNTPFDGMKLKGWPTLTMVAGKIVMKDGNLRV